MKKKKTARGFEYYEFKDSKGVECKIQESSSATDECIWLGADKIGLKAFISGEGWVDMPSIDSGNLHVANNRMHLDRKQVAKLLPILQKFAETGEI